MIIDFHTHIFPDAIAQKTIPFLEKRSGITAATDGTLNGLLHSMEQSGVDLSVIMPVVTKPSQFDSINVFAKNINEQSKGNVLSFGGIHPDCEDYKEKLEYINISTITKVVEDEIVRWVFAVTVQIGGLPNE